MNDDPGWGPAFSKPHLFLVFWFAPYLLMRTKMDGLTRLRTMFIAILFSLAGIYAISAWLLNSGDEEPGQVGLWTSLVALFGLVMLGLIVLSRRRMERQADESNIGSTYVTTFFLDYALAMSAALLGFVSLFVTHSALPLTVGFVFALAGLLLIAPGRHEVQRWQNHFQARGMNVSFVRAVMEAPAPNRSRR